MAASKERRDARAEAREQIRAFLCTRRARISPEQAGLPVYGGERRRVSGLRREEVAALAGISSEYYIKLERGNATGISDGVISGIAHALQLDDAERMHLVDLIRAVTTTGSAQRAAATQRIRPTVQRVIDSMTDSPAFVLNSRLDILAANVLGRAVYAPIFAEQITPPNNARFVFLNANATEFFRDWDKIANDTVALLRAEAGRDPYERALSDLVGELSTRSDEFRVRWADHNVRIHTTGIKRIHHPVVGDLDLSFESFPVPGEPNQSMLVYTTEPGSPWHDALSLLASWTTSPTAVSDEIAVNAEERQ